MKTERILSSKATMEQRDKIGTQIINIFIDNDLSYGEANDILSFVRMRLQTTSLSKDINNFQLF